MTRSWSERRSRSSVRACSPRITPGWPGRSTTSWCRESPPTHGARGGRWSMLETAREVLEGEEAWVVGGAVRDELLGRELVDLDIALRDPKEAARAYARRSGV